MKGEDEQIKRVADIYAHHPLALTVLGGLLRKKYGGRLSSLPKITVLDSKRALFQLFDETQRNLPGGDAAEQLLRVASHSIENPPLAAVAAAMLSPTASFNDLLELVVTLADWQLMKWDGDSEVVHLHPLVKQYFSGLVGVPKSSAIHGRFSTWYSQQPIPNDASSLEHLRPRILAIEHALMADDVSRCGTLMFSPVTKNYPFVEWLAAWGHHVTGIELLGKLAMAAPPLMRAELLIARAAFQRQLGVFAAALVDLDEAIALLDCGDIKLPPDRLANLAGALINKGNVYRQASPLGEAIKNYDRALSVLDQLAFDDPNRGVQMACVLMNRGIAWRDMGRYSEAAVDCDRALKMYRDMVASGMNDLRPMFASALINRGNARAELRESEPALRDFTEAITVYERLLQEGRREMSPQLVHVRVMKAATLNDAGHGQEAIRELDEAIGTLRSLINEGRRDLEPLLGLSWMDRSLAGIRLQRWSPALDDCDRAIKLYDQLVSGGRDELTGWLAHALMNRSEARYAIGNVEGSAADRNRGLDLMRRLIARGEIEIRVIYLRKSISAARYLLANHSTEAMGLLDRALSEAEKGLEEGYAVEALRIEAQLGLNELTTAEPELRWSQLFTTVIQRLQRCAGVE